MPRQTDARPGSQRKGPAAVADPVHLRHTENAGEADASDASTGPAMRLVAMWKRAIALDEEQLLSLGCGFALLDVVAGLSACFAPLLTPLLAVARVAGLAILVPGGLRALAIRHADRSDAELMKAVAVAVGLAALYLALRTSVVVKMCSL